MVKGFAGTLALVAALGAGSSCWGQAGLTPGARAGNSIVPSTHTPGCGGIMCDADDPRRQPGAPLPPPCTGLICGLAPYGMAPPVTAAEAQRMQEERARATAAAAAPVAPVKTKHRHIAKVHKSGTKAVAARTPDTAAAAPPAQK